MEDLSWILGLMRANSNAVGFIPSTTVRDRYLKRGWYVMQLDEKGNKVGYLLHGPIKPGKQVTISQHCIDYDKRLRGYGEKAFKTVLERAIQGNASCIALRVAEDLEAVHFWLRLGFTPVKVDFPNNTRKRAIISMVFTLQYQDYSLS